MGKNHTHSHQGVFGGSSGSTVLIAGFGVLLGFGMTMFERRRRPV